MGRSKSFDPKVTLDKAMEIFWKQGYYATSMEDLVNGLGINRASLYDTYGGKRELYMAALEKYRTSKMNMVAEHFKKDMTPLQVISTFVHGMIDVDSSGGHKGCFMRNSIVEMCGQDKQVRKLALDTEKSAQASLGKLLSKGQEMGEITKIVTAEELSRYLYSAMSGLCITAIYKKDTKELHDIADTMLATIKAGNER